MVAAVVVLQFDERWQFAHFGAAVGPYGRRFEVEVGIVRMRLLRLKKPQGNCAGAVERGRQENASMIFAFAA